MARASKIYIIRTSEPDSGVVVAFTVKHELVTWLKRHEAALRLQLVPLEPMTSLWVTTVNDGRRGIQTTVPAWEFLDGNR